MEQAKAYPQIEQQLASVQIDWESLLNQQWICNCRYKGNYQRRNRCSDKYCIGCDEFLYWIYFSIYVLFQKETLARQTKKILYAFTKEKTAQKYFVWYGLPIRHLQAFCQDSVWKRVFLERCSV